MKLITATGFNNSIGLNGGLPWKCREDLQHFKRMTLGCKLLVGRKTFETLPPLKDRELIVVGTGHFTLEEALSKNPDWVIGGASLYKSTMHLCEEIHISHIKDFTIGDTFFELIPGEYSVHHYYFESDCVKLLHGRT